MHVLGSRVLASSALLICPIVALFGDISSRQINCAGLMSIVHAVVTCDILFCWVPLPVRGAFVEFCAFALLYQPCPGDNIDRNVLSLS